MSLEGKLFNLSSTRTVNPETIEMLCEKDEKKGNGCTASDIKGFGVGGCAVSIDLYSPEVLKSCRVSS